MRLDHVFVTPTLGVRAVRTARSAGSDHRRIVADLVPRATIHSRTRSNRVSGR